MTGTEILALPMQANDAGAATISEYLRTLLCALWDQESGFNSARPFGKVLWQYQIYAALIRGGAIRGVVDKDGTIEDMDSHAGDRLIQEAIAVL